MLFFEKQTSAMTPYCYNWNFLTFKRCLEVAVSITIKNIEQGSTADKIGLKVGDKLLFVDENPINDGLDYQFYTENFEFKLKAQINNEIKEINVQKSERDFGCEFESYLADEKHACKNHCMFCFIDQLPEGMRKTLYFKDDDERLSFLFGNYVTLTNLSDHEINRIIKMRISPINVSVHTTNPELRVKMMANKDAGKALGYLKKLADAGIDINCQLVLCQGVNDGEELRRTLDDLLELRPALQNIGVVPAGITRFREGLYPLKAYDKQSSCKVLDILDEYGNFCLKKHGNRIVFASDEWYICTGRKIPDDDFYEEYALLDNGIGMWRNFKEEFLAELAAPHRIYSDKNMDVVTGTLISPLICEMMKVLKEQYPMINVNVHTISNDFFGGNVSVAGLVTATDIIAQCKGKLKSDTLGIPEVMLRSEKDMFLDSITTEQLGTELGVKIKILPASGGLLAKELLKSGLMIKRRK